MSSFRPMLAADISGDLDKLRFPIYVTPKLDGVRCLIFMDGLRSRSMKPIPNKFVNARFGRDADLFGLDGELILGPPTAKDVYRVTLSAISRIDGEPDVKFHAFDLTDIPDTSYSYRLETMKRYKHPYVEYVPARLCYDMDELMVIEQEYLDSGYEGVILRAPKAGYKFNRSTVKEQGMLKLKRFVDSEAVILRMEEEQHNANEAKTNELGRTERSSHKENLRGKGTMGALWVSDEKLFPFEEFKIGTGFSAEDRRVFWRDRESFIGTTIKYQYFPIGVKDKPRHGVYLGMREAWD